MIRLTLFPSRLYEARFPGPPNNIFESRHGIPLVALVLQSSIIKSHIINNDHIQSSDLESCYERMQKLVLQVN